MGGGGGGSGDPALIDSFNESNLYSTISQAFFGQAITLASAASISSAKFYLKKFGSPTSDMVAKLYAATGSVGTTAKPTGSALATSAAIAASTLSADDLALVEFTFTTPYSASSGDLCIALDFPGGDGSNAISFGYAYTANLHPGNGFYGSNADGSMDVIFYLYGS